MNKDNLVNKLNTLDMLVSNRALKSEVIEELNKLDLLQVVEICIDCGFTFLLPVVEKLVKESKNDSQ